MSENPLGGLLGGLLGGQGQGQGGQGGGLAALLPGLLKMLQGGGQGGGGLGGLIGQLQGSGLGDQVQSWIGGGDNKAVSGDDLENAVGADTVDKLARDAGVSHQEAKDGLAQILPQVVDKLSPGGKLPDAGGLGDLLGGFLGGGKK